MTILYGVIPENDLDPLTSGDLALGSRSPKMEPIGPWITFNNCVEFHKDVVSSF